MADLKDINNPLNEILPSYRKVIYEGRSIFTEPGVISV